MAHINNIYNLKVNGVSTAGSINFGNVINKGHQANVKANINDFEIGDDVSSPSQSNNLNVSNDPDVQDQNQAQV